MKLPSLNMAALTDFAVRHGEKVVVALTALGGLMLVWGGVDALRSLSVKESQTPAAVEQAAARARAHIDGEPQPPADLLPPRTPLADVVDPWRTPLVPWKPGAAGGLVIADPPTVAVLDNPLFKEAMKRGKPDVYPLEDLRAVAGLAVVPAAGDVQPGQPAAGRDRILPYVVVTGLIPVAKQQDEYRRRFAACGFRDAKRDSPLWSDFEIDRGTVGPDGMETWTRLDLAAVGAQQAAAAGDAAATDLPAALQLGAGEDARSRQTTPIPFCSGLPQRSDGTWELADLHPWILERLEKFRAEANRPQDAPPPAPDVAPVGDAPEFGGADERPANQQPVAMREERLDYRLFRFLDTAVEPGRTYRYRVRLKVWNPNYDKLPERMRPHLSDPDLAKEMKLPSPDSEPSPTATVPDTTRLLVAPLRRSEIKEMRLKPGTLEVLVLGPSKETGTLALRALVADTGAVVDVDESVNLRNQRDRARGEKIVTGRLLVDARGRQEDRRDGAPGVIPEPLDVIGMRPDGSFEIATAADSERPFAAYAATFPARSAKAASTEPAAGDPAGADPLGGGAAPDPLSRPGANR